MQYTKKGIKSLLTYPFPFKYLFKHFFIFLELIPRWFFQPLLWVLQSLQLSL